MELLTKDFFRKHARLLGTSETDRVKFEMLARRKFEEFLVQAHSGNVSANKLKQVETALARTIEQEAQSLPQINS